MNLKPPDKSALMHLGDHGVSNPAKLASSMHWKFYTVQRMERILKKLRREGLIEWPDSNGFQLSGRGRTTVMAFKKDWRNARV